MGGSHVPQARRKTLSAAAVLITALVGAACLSSPALALSTKAMTPNTVTALADPETTLAVPVDGRINGYRFAGKVLGVATGTRLGTGTDQITAAPGQRLWVFGLEWTGTTNQDGTPEQVSSTLVVDGTRIAFPAEPYGPQSPDSSQPDSSWDTGATYWAASVPAAAHDVAVELAAGGYAQTFSLSKMAREGTQPDVLYRDASSWEVDQPLTAEHDIPLVDPRGDVSGTVLPVVLNNVTLSWFGPDTPSDTPTDPGTAWLVPGLTTAGSSNTGENMCFQNTLPAADITLTVPGDPHPLTATAFPGIGPDANDQGEGAFTAAYGFQVPAGITTATLTVNPGSSIQADAAACFLFTPFIPQGTASFALTLPTTAWTPPAGASTTPAPIGTLASTQTVSNPGHHPTSGFPAVPLIIGLLLAAAGAAAIVLVRRRSIFVPAGPPKFSAPPTGPGPDGPPGPSWVDRRAPEAPPSAGSEHPAPPTDSPGGVAEASPVEKPARQTLTAIPDAAAHPPSEAVQVLLLGHPEVAGWPEGTEPPSGTALEILVFLALHPGRRYSAEQIRDELCQRRKRNLEVGTIRRYINELRQVLGVRLPEARGIGGYELLDVRTDADQFKDLTAQAGVADDPATKAALLADALSLVRGAPFAEVPAGSYGWADIGDYVRGELAHLILAASQALADLATAHGDTNLAIWAVRQGLLAWPADDSLFERFLLAGAVDTPAHVVRVWKEINDRLTAQEETPSTELYELYRRLRGSS
jgi:hypothetical protein